MPVCLYQTPMSANAPFPSRLLNRELGTLEFNRRVLFQALDDTNPLLERLRFLSIVSSNMDEFFETRVATLQDMLEADPMSRTPDGRLVSDVLAEVSERAHALIADQYRVLQQAVLPELERAGIRIYRVNDWSEAQRAWAQHYFETEVSPLLTPIGLDPAHPFPRVINKNLVFAVQLHGTDAFGRNIELGVLQAPRTLPRIVPMPAELCDARYGFMLLSSCVQAFAGQLFPGLELRGVHQFRVTRNSELFIDDDDITNLRAALQGELRARHFGDAVRLEVAADCPREVIDRLLRENNILPQDCYRVDGPVNLVRLQEILDHVNAPQLLFPPYQPALPPDWPGVDTEIFDRIRARDLLLHHPYDSFAPVVDLVKTAARDPSVVAIKQTIYRTGGNSELMDALIEAARNGKEVTVVLELMARLDEETNINWSSRLEDAGAHVVFGVVGFKCHAKMLLIVRREADANSGRKTLRMYAHLSTGNYHARTARLYTDFGLMTANPEICEDVRRVFLQITGSSQVQQLKHLWQSPFTLHANVLAAIAREAEHARNGKPARVWARVNALLEPAVIEALYAASQAGVEIRLLVRGACMLRPGVPGLSDNIRVRSTIGRFLEHSRVFYFHNGGEAEVYISSADWMERNLLRRVEIAVPLLDNRIKAQVIREGLRMQWQHPGNAWDMDSDGNYHRPRGSRSRLSCHQVLMHSRLKHQN